MIAYQTRTQIMHADRLDVDPINDDLAFSWVDLCISSQYLSPSPPLLYSQSAEHSWPGLTSHYLSVREDRSAHAASTRRKPRGEQAEALVHSGR
jgi:hypothetical protein